MRITPTTGLPHRVLIVALLALSLSTSTGCAWMSRGMSSLTNAWAIHVQERNDLHEIRQDTARELAQQREELRRAEAEREVNNARIEAQNRQLEAEFCKANQEALQEQLRSNIKETLESKVAFNVEHGLEVGELEVDTEALKEMLKKRDENPQEAVTAPPKKPCACCDQPCGCRPGLIRRLCPHCRHKPCEAEKNCGGPEALTRLEQEPLKQPLRPAEIPMKLPVRLTFGMQQPQMEAARIRKEPVKKNEPCDVPCTDPACPCTVKVPSGTMAPVTGTGKGTPATVPVKEQLTPPVPEPDTAEEDERPQIQFRPIKFGKANIVAD